MIARECPGRGAHLVQSRNTRRNVPTFTCGFAAIFARQVGQKSNLVG
jgi:hypothetical protein